MFLDLILCRNVAIYFDPAVTQSVIARFYDALVDGGWLAVGHSEHSAARFRQFQVHAYPNAILYQRTGQPVDQEVDWNRPSPPSEPVAVQTSETPSVAHATQTPVCEVKPESKEEDLQGENLLDRARDLLTYGHSEEVRDLLMETLDAGPERADSCALLGQAYANLGDWSAAETWCRRAVQLDQLMEDPYYTLALVLQHQGHLEQALATMKKVVYLNSNSERGHYGLANLYYSLGQLPQALKSLDNARRLMADRAESEVLPGTGGLTIGHLRQAIVMQQQQWSTEAAARNRT
jgi:chemotaxis protein methyltransferase CheR